MQTIPLAKTKDGEDVAVKLQYPDVSRLLEVDTSTMQLLSDFASFFFKDFSFSWVVQEFKVNLRSEFDFTNEARNSDLTNERFSHRGLSVRTPRIRWDLTRKRMLTMEFIQGTKINDAEGLKKQGFNPREVGRLLVDVFAEMIYCHGVLHADPHAGNMMVVPSPAGKNKPQIVLLDHGLYRTLDERFRLLYCNLWKAMLLGDVKLLSTVAEELGVAKYST
jgi:aarF domain-containing kinase